MAVKPKKLSATEKAAFKRFVELVKPIEAVRCVALIDGGSLEVITYVTGRSQKDYEEISNAEDEIIEGFPGVVIEFHVYGIESLTKNQMQRSALIFERQSDG